MKKFTAGLLLLSAFLLTGCASTFTSHIKTVNQLPEALQDKSYTLTEHPEQAKEPEYLHATEDLKARLQELGFNEVASEKATLKISLQLISIPGNVHVSSLYGPVSYIVTPSGLVIPMGGFNTRHLYSGFLRYPYPMGVRSVFYPRYIRPIYSPFAFGRMYDPFYGSQLEARQYFDHGIEVSINDAKTGKLLYAVTAKTNQADENIDPYIALLVESALREFPNKTGESKVEIELEK